MYPTLNPEIRERLTQSRCNEIRKLFDLKEDVAVDIRTESATFGQWFGVILNDENHFQLFIPKGFAHGFCVLSEIVDFHYKCSDYYNPKAEQGILWSDPSLAIKWPVHAPLISTKDKKYNCLKNISSELLF